MLKRKTILITGGGSGIGEALAVQLANDNKVIICGRNEDKLKKVANTSRNISYYVADISIPTEIDNLFKRIADDKITLDVLFNNAGVVERLDVREATFSSTQIFEKVNTNLSGAIVVTQHFIQQANNSAENLIINVTSGIVGFTVPTQPLYVASKSGLNAYTKLLRYQLKNTNFKVVEILPPGVYTEMPKGLGFKNADKFPLPSAYVKKVIASINKGKTEYAPSGLSLVKFFLLLLPNTTLKLVDKAGKKMFAS